MQKPESAAALQAFEDYYQLGPGRSLKKLLTKYLADKRNEISIPTSQFRTLADWSSKYAWQERIKQRIAEDAAEYRSRALEFSMRIKDNVMLVLDAETQALVTKLQNNPGELITGIGGLGSLVELLGKLLGEQTPAQRLELTGALQVESNINGNLIADPAIRALSLALVARTPDGETDASEPGDATE